MAPSLGNRGKKGRRRRDERILELTISPGPGLVSPKKKGTVVTRALKPSFVFFFKGGKWVAIRLKRDLLVLRFSSSSFFLFPAVLPSSTINGPQG